MVKISKIVGLLIYIAQKQGWDALKATHKSSSLCIVPFLKKSRKTAKNYHFFKIDNFCQFFWIFSETVVFRDMRFFALHSVHQNPSLELSNSTIRQIFLFFSIKGGKSQTLTTPLKLGENLKLNFFWIFSQKDQESRWYSMFKRLNKNFLKIRITLLWDTVK